MNYIEVAWISCDEAKCGKFPKLVSWNKACGNFRVLMCYRPFISGGSRLSSLVRTVSAYGIYFQCKLNDGVVSKTGFDKTCLLHWYYTTTRYTIVCIP